jgi:hypothetical protein
MKVTIEIYEEPVLNGEDLCEYVRQASAMINYNIGPEPLRATRGPLYHDPVKADRMVGSWAVEL